MDAFSLTSGTAMLVGYSESVDRSCIVLPGNEQMLSVLFTRVTALAFLMEERLQLLCLPPESWRND